MHNRPGPLTRQLEQFRAGFLARLPVAERRAVLEAAEDLRAETWAGKAPEVGDLAPDFTLPDQHERTVCLSDRLALGPAVLLFVRGGWCPFCTLTLRAYQQALPAIQAAGADLLAITPQPASRCSDVAERDLLAFPVLSDAGNEVARRYGIAYELAPALQAVYRRLGHDLPKLNQTGNWQIPLPATFIVDTEGRVAAAHVEPVAHRRLEPEEVLRTLEAMRAKQLAKAAAPAGGVRVHA